MKRKLLAGIVAFGLTASMVTGSLYTVNGTGVVQAAELAARAEGRTWDLTGANPDRPALEGAAGELDVSVNNGEVSISVNGSPVTFPDEKPFIDSNDRTQIPVG